MIFDTLQDIFWEHTTAIDEPGTYAVEAYILEHYPLIAEVAPIPYSLYYVDEEDYNLRCIEGDVDLSNIISQLKQHYPEEFL